MKKKLLLGLLVGTAPFMLAACGSKDKDKDSEKESSSVKTITCTGNKEGEIKVSIKYDTKDETIKSAGMTYELDLSGYEEEERAELKKLNLCDSFKSDENYSDCKPINTDSAFGVDLTFDKDKLKENYSEDEKLTVESLTKGFEEELGLKCDVK